MTAQERKERRREQLRKGKAKYKIKLKSSASEDITRKSTHLQHKRMAIALKKTPDSIKN